MASSRRAGWGALVFIFLVAAYLASVFLRLPEIRAESAGQGVQASYHALLTIRALGESGPEVHGFLPTVSLGRQADKGISWGATLPSKHGELIYTSFTPPLFMAPYVFFTLSGLEQSIANLAVFNLLLQLATVLLLYVFLREFLQTSAAGLSKGRWIAALLACSCIFSREAMLSFGLVYWAQQVYQLVLIASLLLTLRLLRAPEMRRLQVWLLLFLCFAGAYTEWSGFVFNAGLAGAFVFLGVRQKRPEFTGIALKIIAVTVVAALLIIVHFSSILGYEQTLSALARRFLARSAAAGSWSLYLKGLFLSFGPLLLWLVLLAVYVFVVLKKRLNLTALAGVMLFAACFVLIANVLMLQHATQFSYDRLKWLVPMSMLSGLLLMHVSDQAIAVFSGLYIVALGVCVWMYFGDLAGYASWESVARSNRMLVNEVSKQADLNCSVLLSNQKVRGYDNLVFGRGIHEFKSMADVRGAFKDASACSVVFVSGRQHFPDLPAYEKAVIVWPNGDQKAFVIDEAGDLKALESGVSGALM